MGVEAGVHAEVTDAPSGLLHAGESWAGGSYEVPWHTHEGWEFYLQLHGRSAWTVEAQTLQLAPGWLFAVPPGARHRGAAPTQARHHFAYAAVDLEVLGRRHPELAGAWPSGGPLWSPRGASLAPAFRTLVAEVAEDRPFGDAAVTAALDLLVARVARALLAVERPQPRVARHPAVARARQLVDDDFAKPWTIEELAAACAQSRSRLTELFTAEVGQPPYDYLLERRVERAAELLATTTRSISEVAAEVGFGSHMQLARQFRRVLEMAPREWRALHRTGQEA